MLVVNQVHVILHAGDGGAFRLARYRNRNRSPGSGSLAHDLDLIIVPGHDPLVAVRESTALQNPLGQLLRAPSRAIQGVSGQLNRPASTKVVRAGRRTPAIRISAINVAVAVIILAISALDLLGRRHTRVPLAGGSVARLNALGTASGHAGTGVVGRTRALHARTVVHNAVIVVVQGVADFRNLAVGGQSTVRILTILLAVAVIVQAVRTIFRRRLAGLWLAIEIAVLTADRSARGHALGSGVVHASEWFIHRAITIVIQPVASISDLTSESARRRGIVPFEGTVTAVCRITRMVGTRVQAIPTHLRWFADAGDVVGALRIIAVGLVVAVVIHAIVANLGLTADEVHLAVIVRAVNLTIAVIVQAVRTVGLRNCNLGAGIPLAGRGVARLRPGQRRRSAHEDAGLAVAGHTRALHARTIVHNAVIVVVQSVADIDLAVDRLIAIRIFTILLAIPIVIRVVVADFGRGRGRVERTGLLHLSAVNICIRFSFGLHIGHIRVGVRSGVNLGTAGMRNT
ncbi:MAG: hypothetical protein BWY14_00221 [Parcubacteria group bacterium ADurb.Bin192]|nr:MAG: hypothetical protein BWY14_00221 [Parcubacteria group bacterium ADurb.Bin192]